MKSLNGGCKLRFSILEEKKSDIMRYYIYIYMIERDRNRKRWIKKMNDRNSDLIASSSYAPRLLIHQYKAFEEII